MSFIERLHEARNTIIPSSPWLPVLRKIKGQRGIDGLERIATEHIFERLDIPPVRRTPQAAKQVCQLMTGLGWSATRVRAVTSRGRAARVRGYARVFHRSS